MASGSWVPVVRQCLNLSFNSLLGSWGCVLEVITPLPAFVPSWKSVDSNTQALGYCAEPYCLREGLYPLLPRQGKKPA